MVLAELGEKALGGIALAIVLVHPALLEDGFGPYGDDFSKVGVNQGPGEQLVRIGHLAVLVMLLQAMRAMDFLGAKVLDTVARQQVTALVEHKRLKDFATLEFPKDVRKAGTEPLGIDRVEEDAHLGVGRDMLDTVDGAQVVVFDPLLKSERGWLLQAKQSKAAHERIGQRDGGITQTTVGNGLKPLAGFAYA